VVEPSGELTKLVWVSSSNMLLWTTVVVSLSTPKRDVSSEIAMGLRARREWCELELLRNSSMREGLVPERVMGSTLYARAFALGGVPPVPLSGVKRAKRPLVVLYNQSKITSMNDCMNVCMNVCTNV
jgi:hypothetical protein